MANAMYYILSIQEKDGLPSVEVCESMAEVMKSVEWQLCDAKSPAILKQAEQALSTTRTWTDSEGTIYTLRQRGGK